MVGNAGDDEAWDLVDDESFDVITFGDVLEHLGDPLAVLRTAVRKLKPTGFVVTSLPNVAHGDVRLSLLHGAFRYRETGLLDRTHVRFFTLETTTRAAREAGLVVVDTRHVIMPLFHTELGLSREDYPDAVVDEIRADAEFETYQFVMQSVIDNGSLAIANMANRLDVLADRVQELEVRNRILEDQVVQLADYDELREEQARVGAQMEAWIQHVVELNEQIGRAERADRADFNEELEAATARQTSSGRPPRRSGEQPRAPSARSTPSGAHGRTGSRNRSAGWARHCGVAGRDPSRARSAPAGPLTLPSGPHERSHVRIARSQREQRRLLHRDVLEERLRARPEPDQRGSRATPGASGTSIFAGPRAGPSSGRSSSTAGTGGWNAELVEHGLIAGGVGIDYSQTLLDEATATAGRAGMALTYHQANVNQGTFPDGGVRPRGEPRRRPPHRRHRPRLPGDLPDPPPDDGWFVSFDYVGPHRNQYRLDAWEEAWQELNHELPEALRQDLVYPPIPVMLMVDPTEAVHSELIVETFRRYFSEGQFTALGGAIAYPLLTHNTRMFEAADVDCRIGDEKDFGIAWRGDHKDMADPDRPVRNPPSADTTACA